MMQDILGKKAILVLVFFVVFQKLYSQGTLVFENDFVLTEVLSKTQSTNVNIVIFVHEDNNVFSQAYQNEHFKDRRVVKIMNNSRLLVTSSGDKNYELIKSKYGVSNLPSFIFLNPQGQVLKKVAGYYTIDEFVGLAAEAYSENQNDLYLQSIVNQGVSESDILFNYAKSLQIGAGDFSEYAAKLFELLPIDYSNPIYIESVLRFDANYESERFVDLLSNFKKLEYKQLGEDMVADIISNSIVEWIGNQVYKQPKFKVSDTINGICKKYDLDFQNKILAKYNFVNGRNKKNVGDDYFEALLYMVKEDYKISRSNFLRYELMLEYMGSAKSDSQIAAAFAVLNQIFLETSRADFKYLYIKLLIKDGRVQEFDESLMILKKYNLAKPIYSDAEISLIEKEVAKAKKDFSGRKSKGKGKK